MVIPQYTAHFFLAHSFLDGGIDAPPTTFLPRCILVALSMRCAASSPTPLSMHRSLLFLSLFCRRRHQCAAQCYLARCCLVAGATLSMLLLVTPTSIHRPPAAVSLALADMAHITAVMPLVTQADVETPPTAVSLSHTLFPRPSSGSRRRKLNSPPATRCCLARSLSPT